MEPPALPRRETKRFLRTMRWVVAWGSVILLGADLAIASAPKFTELLDLARSRLNNWGKLEWQLKVPGAGLEVLGPNVGAGIDLFGATGATTYRLSPGIAQDPYLMQRIEETAWPVAFDATSHFVLRKIEESSSCKQLSAKRGMAIDYCD